MIRKFPRALLNTRWRIACRLLCQSSRIYPRSLRRCLSSMGPNRASRERLPPIACWRDGWQNAASGSFNCSIAAGIQHLHLPKQIVGQSRDTDQPSAALIADSEAAGFAQRHADRLGRRGSGGQCIARVS